MSTPHLHDTVSRLEQKIQQLLHLHQQYKQAYGDLLESNEQLAEDNQRLRQQLANAANNNNSHTPAPSTAPTTEQPANSSVSAPENAALKRQIQQYLRQIDQTIEWVASLRPPYILP